MLCPSYQHYLCTLGNNDFERSHGMNDGTRTAYDLRMFSISHCFNICVYVSNYRHTEVEADNKDTALVY